MNLKGALLKEYSKQQSDKIVNYVSNYQSRFDVLIALFLSGPYRTTQRAARPVSILAERHPELIKPHLKAMLKFVESSQAQVAVRRNVIRLLQFIEIPKSLQGRVVNICFGFLQNPREPIAVSVFSMTVLANIARELPDLKNELIPLIQNKMPYASAGFVSRGRKVIEEVESWEVESKK